MPSFLKPYYDTEGPFGLPMRDQQALQLEALVKKLPREKFFEPKKAIITREPTELLPGERTDISWISEESIDRQGDVVLAAGMDDSHFRLNPLVTMNHAYWLPPVGKSLWRQQASAGPLRGIKAKTQYPPRPESWPAHADWPPDIAFTLVQAGLLRGKSVSFLPVQVRRPATEEIANNPALARVRFLIEKWILLEYACVYLPAQQHAMVESVSKSLNIPEEYRKALGWPEAPADRETGCQSCPKADLTDHRIGCQSCQPADQCSNTRTLSPDRLGPPPALGVISFTPLTEVEKALQRRLAALDIAGLVHQALHRSWDKIRGHI